MLLKFLLNITILILLIVGTWSDIKTRTVSNKITFAVMLLSLPLIYFNSENIIPQTYVIGIVFAIMYFIKSIGGADLKVLLPITFIVSNLFYFLLFFSGIGLLWSCGEAMIKKESKNIPAFVPITVAFAAVMFFV